jgi:hypothetical protein
MWVRKVRSAPRGARTVCVPPPVARALLEKSPFVEVVPEGGRLLVKPAPPELVERALREAGARGLWRRGVYKLMRQRGGNGGWAWRLTLPARLAKPWGRYVKIYEVEGGFAVEPVSEEEARRLIEAEAARSMLEVLRAWGERAERGEEPAR